MQYDDFLMFWKNLCWYIGAEQFGLVPRRYRMFNNF